MDAVQQLALEAWLDTSNEGLLVASETGAILVVNPRLKDLLQLRTVPKTVDQLLQQMRLASPELRDILLPNEPITHKKWGTLRTQQHPPRWFSWEQIPLMQDGNLSGTVTVFREAAEQEGQVEFAKQSFLSMISHDLRTPLSTILGFGELLYHNRQSLSDDEQKEFLGHIIKNANDLSRYTQIALDIMFLEANLQSFEMEPVYLDRFVKHWLSDAVHRFPAKRLEYLNGSADDPMTRISSAALHKILTILTEFALAESPPDDVIKIKLSYDEENAHIVFKHTAPGLSKADVAVLFQLMQPRDLSETGRPQLHRMQLYVASLLAERQQGNLTLRGQDDFLYEIDLSLPLLPPEA
jgi:signal transduction histidine kinase